MAPLCAAGVVAARHPATCNYAALAGAVAFSSSFVPRTALFTTTENPRPDFFAHKRRPPKPQRSPRRRVRLDSRNETPTVPRQDGSHRRLVLGRASYVPPFLVAVEVTRLKLIRPPTTLDSIRVSSPRLLRKAGAWTGGIAGPAHQNRERLKNRGGGSGRAATTPPARSGRHAGNRSVLPPKPVAPLCAARRLAARAVPPFDASAPFPKLPPAARAVNLLLRSRCP